MSTDRPTEPIDAALRGLRPVAASTVALLLVVRRWGHPGDLTLVAAVTTVAVAVGTYVAGRIATPRLHADHPRLATLVQASLIGVDAAVTVLAVTRLGLFDPDLSWALLVLPVLEGAVRHRLRGAITVWVGVSAAYLALSATPPAHGDPVTRALFLAQIQTLVHRCGVVLLVAVPGGYLSDQLLRAISAHRQAQLSARSRSSLLVRVVEAGRSLGHLGVDLPATVVGAALTLGFAAADWAERDQDGTWRAGHRQPDRALLPPPSLLGGQCEQAAAIRRTVIADRADDNPMITGLLAGGELEAVLAVPVVGRTGTTGVLRVAVAAGDVVTTQQIDSLELLAGQAGVAADNAVLLGEIQEARNDLEHQATHDSLTGLPNRAKIQDDLTVAIAGVANDPAPLSVLFLDLDRFKEVNDHLGHDVGDELLRIVAKRLRNVVGSPATVARLGGDEFVVLVPGLDADDAAALAAAIVDRLADPFVLGSHRIQIGASVGVVATDSYVEANELIRRGDLAMYQAKSGGRSTWRRYSAELDQEGRSDSRIESELRIALDQGLLSAAYQPVVRLADREVVGVEALVRWHRADGPMPPDRFVPIAERSGLIDALGRFMLETACADSGGWVAGNSLGPLALAVNVSPQQVRRDGFVDLVLATLSAHGRAPASLVLELTERDLIDAGIAEPLRDLRAAGVRVAIDDFGQGHTSLGTLTRMPVDILKVDRSFVTDLDRLANRLAIVRSMISLGHDLGMTVIAEGVERPGELDCLADLGCDEVQGYLLSPPLTPDAAAALLVPTPATSAAGPAAAAAAAAGTER